MLKRRQKSPEERRIDRIRRSWMATAAGLLLLTLLIVAWFGAAFARRTPPKSLMPVHPSDGTLLFRLSPVMDEAIERTNPETAQMRRFLDNQSKTLLHALAPSGQMFFWTTPNGTEWLAFVAFIRPQQVYRRKVSAGFEDANGFAPVGSPESEDSKGFYVIDRNGVFLSSRTELPEFELLEGAARLETSLAAQYSTWSDLLPTQWREAVFDESNSPIAEIRWPADPKAEVIVRMNSGEVAIVPRFDIIPIGETPK